MPTLVAFITLLRLVQGKAESVVSVADVYIHLQLKMKPAGTRATVLECFSGEAQKSPTTRMYTQFYRISGKRSSASTQQQRATDFSECVEEERIMRNLLKKPDRSGRQTCGVLPRLLSLELLLVHASLLTPALLSCVHGVKREGIPESWGVNTHAEKAMYKHLAAEKQMVNKMPSQLLSVNFVTTRATAAALIDTPGEGTQNQKTTALLDRTSVTEGSSNDWLKARKGAAAATGNPWEGLLTKFDVPRVHGSGVKVDLGNNKKFGSKIYREPGGLCPVYGKFIRLFQPTRNPQIWPNNYLVEVPLAGTPQDTMPLGGGFGLPIPKISPKTLAELKAHVRAADTVANPNPYMMYYRRQIKDNLGYCIWWTRISPALDPDNPDLNMDMRYRYSIVWDESEKKCTLLYVNMQEMRGAGTYCTMGDGKPVLTWYCFTPMKTVEMKNRVWASPYTRMDHNTACPRSGLKHVHWGQWNGHECQKIAPRKRVAVSDPAQCALVLFDNSPSDNPTKYVGDEGRGWDQIFDNLPGVLFPAGATGNDQPHSRGVGVNWANYYPRSNKREPRKNNECEMYDGVPDCLTIAHGGFAFVSLASPDPQDATLPPCEPALEGVFIGGPCRCPLNKQKGWRCTQGTWEEGEEKCTCEKSESSGGVNAWAVAGPIVIGGILLGLLGAYLITKRRRYRPSVHRDIIGDNTHERVVQQRKTQTDLLQEAEPSFWREAKEDDPTVVLYGDRMDQEF